MEDFTSHGCCTKPRQVTGRDLHLVFTSVMKGQGRERVLSKWSRDLKIHLIALKWNKVLAGKKHK